MGSRGGIVARKAAEQRQRESVKYGLVGVRINSVIAECHDKYGRWELGHRLGVLSTNTGNRVGVVWEGDEYPTMYTQAEARYKVDRNPPLWRIIPPHQRNIFDIVGDKPEQNAALRTLTPTSADGMIAPSPHTEVMMTPLTEEEAMPKTAEQPAADNAVKTTPAKALARALGIDPKVLRKFLRSASCSFDPVGQGGRYEFSDAQVATITREFNDYKRGSKTEVKVDAKQIEAAGNLPKRTKPAPKKQEPEPEPVLEEELDLEDAELEPSPDDLNELEDMDLSLDDLED